MEDIDEQGDVDDINAEITLNTEPLLDIVEPSSSTTVEKKKPKKKTCIKTVQTEQEIAAVLKFFSQFIKREVVPGKAKCDECMKKHPVFGTRKWTDKILC